jgi:hypothetical protein
VQRVVRDVVEVAQLLQCCKAKIIWRSADNGCEIFSSLETLLQAGFGDNSPKAARNVRDLVKQTGDMEAALFEGSTTRTPVLILIAELVKIVTREFEQKRNALRAAFERMIARKGEVEKEASYHLIAGLVYSTVHSCGRYTRHLPYYFRANKHC